MHVHVVEDEAAAVQVHDNARRRVVGSVEAAWHSPGVDVADLGHGDARVRSGLRAGSTTRGVDVEPLVEDLRLTGGGLDRPPGLRVQHRAPPPQRCISASRPTPMAAATRKSTRWSGTSIV